MFTIQQIRLVQQLIYAGISREDLEALFDILKGTKEQEAKLPKVDVIENKAINKNK